MLRWEDITEEQLTILIKSHVSRISTQRLETRPICIGPTRRRCGGHANLSCSIAIPSSIFEVVKKCFTNLELSEWNHMTYWLVCFHGKAGRKSKRTDHTDLLKMTENKAVRQSTWCTSEDSPFGRSTILDVEILLPEMGFKASFCRVQETRSLDWARDAQRQKSHITKGELNLLNNKRLLWRGRCCVICPRRTSRKLIQPRRHQLSTICGKRSITNFQKATTMSLNNIAACICPSSPRHDDRT